MNRPGTPSFHQESPASRWSWWERWQRGRDLRDLRAVRKARTAAFGFFVQELLLALHQPQHHWMRTVGLLAGRMNNGGFEAWHWHAILRRGYAQDEAAIRQCPKDWGTCTALDLRRRNNDPPPTVQRWLWTAVHANDVWLADRALNDGARANAILIMPARDHRGKDVWTMPMTWLIHAHEQGSLEAGWCHRTGKPLEEWPTTWRFWWGSARGTDDPSPMLHTLALPRRGEELDHHGQRPNVADLQNLALDAERADLRAAIQDVVPTAAVDAEEAPMPQARQRARL